VILRVLLLGRGELGLRGLELLTQIIRRARCTRALFEAVDLTLHPHDVRMVRAVKREQARILRAKAAQLILRRQHRAAVDLDR